MCVPVAWTTAVETDDASCQALALCQQLEEICEGVELTKAQVCTRRSSARDESRRGETVRYTARLMTSFIQELVKRRQ